MNIHKVFVQCFIQSIVGCFTNKIEGGRKAKPVDKLFAIVFLKVVFVFMTIAFFNDFLVVPTIKLHF